MNKFFKILIISTVFLDSLGIFHMDVASDSPYQLDGNFAYAQEEQPEKETTQENKNEESKNPEEEAPAKLKLPKQNKGISPEALRMIEMIEKKNTALKTREDELAAKEKQLKTLGENIQKNLEKIEKALKESKEQFGLKENQIKKNVDALIKVYSTMKPAEAANLIAAIDQHLALQIIAGMKSKVAGQVLSQLDVKVAKAITEKLAGKVEKKNKKPE